MNINKDKNVQLADTDTIENLTSALSQRLIADQLRLTTAESCTGGKLASALCAAEDTPKFYGAGFVTFTDQAKMKILSVSQQSLERYSAVSEKVAAEMATGAIERADADVSIAITGYGGPVKMVRQRVPSGSRGILKARPTLRLCILLATAKRY